MSDHSKQQIFRYIIASVWFINGLFCKVLNLVPRHEQIVASILSEEYARTLTLLIGLGEILIAFWAISSFKPRLSAVVQMILVGTMNIVEFVLVPDLLLWGRYNAVFAFLFIVLIYYNELIRRRKVTAGIQYD